MYQKTFTENVHIGIISNSKKQTNKQKKQNPKNNTMIVINELIKKLLYTNTVEYFSAN